MKPFYINFKKPIMNYKFKKLIFDVQYKFSHVFTNGLGFLSRFIRKICV